MESSGNYRIQFNGKYKGRRIKDVPKNEMEGYLKWLESHLIQNKNVSKKIENLKSEFLKFYNIHPATTIAAG